MTKFLLAQCWSKGRKAREGLWIAFCPPEGITYSHEKERAETCLVTVDRLNVGISYVWEWKSCLGEGERGNMTPTNWGFNGEIWSNTAVNPWLRLFNLAGLSNWATFQWGLLRLWCYRIAVLKSFCCPFKLFSSCWKYGSVCDLFSPLFLQLTTLSLFIQ